MEETERTVLFEKKMGRYPCELNDLPLPGELTLTITLNEYRSLVTAAAECRFYQAKLVSIRAENAELRTRIEIMEAGER